jgi:tetratricopeptide (TPR) repeat protein
MSLSLSETLDKIQHWEHSQQIAPFWNDGVLPSFIEACAHALTYDPTALVKWQRWLDLPGAEGMIYAANGGKEYIAEWQIQWLKSLLDIALTLLQNRPWADCALPELAFSPASRLAFLQDIVYQLQLPLPGNAFNTSVKVHFPLVDKSRISRGILAYFQLEAAEGAGGFLFPAIQGQGSVLNRCLQPDFLRVFELARKHALMLLPSSEMLPNVRVRILAHSPLQDEAVLQNSRLEGNSGAGALLLALWSFLSRRVLRSDFAASFALSEDADSQCYPIDHLIEKLKSCIELRVHHLIVAYNQQPEVRVPGLKIRHAGTLQESCRFALPDNNLPGRNPDFVGHESTLKILRETLNSLPLPQIAIHGLRGIGKTSLALEYAHTHLDNYPGGVFWIQAEDTLQVINAYTELGDFFNVSLSGDAPPHEKAMAVKLELEESRIPTLLIYDNVRDKQVPKWFPRTGKCHILFTTLNLELVSQMPHTMQLSLLDIGSALQLLQKKRKARQEEERQAAIHIAQRLSCLPYVLEIVAQHLARTPISFREYDRRLSSPDSARIMLRKAQKEFEKLSERNQDVFYAIHDAYETLSPVAHDLLKHLSFLPGKPVPCDFVMYLCGGKRSIQGEIDESIIALEDALSDLRDRSLITLTGDDSLTLHELFGIFLQVQFFPNERDDMLVKIASCLTEHLLLVHGSPLRKQLSRLIEHAKDIERLCERHRLQAPQLSLLRVLGMCFTGQYDFHRAYEHFSQGVQLSQQLYGALHSETACLMRHQGESLLEKKLQRKDPLEMQDPSDLLILQEAFRLARQVMGSDDPEIADYHLSLGYSLKYHNQHTEALQHNLDALGMNLRAERLEKAVTCLNNLGTLYEDLEQWDEAVRYLRQACTLSERVFGAEHLDVAMCLNNLGRVLGKLEQRQEALEYHRGAELIYLQLEGEDSLAAGITRYWIACVCLSMGDTPSAMDAFHQAKPVLEQHYPPDHRIWAQPCCIEMMALLQEKK